jgi:nucleotide-binding universal stress UspA family protein
MFARILVPLDGSRLAESVLPHVVAIASSIESQVYLLRVLDQVGAATRPPSVDPFDWQIRKAEAETYLRDISSHLENARLATKGEVIEGNAAESVIDFAHSNAIDLITMSSHGQSGISGWNVSSVVQKIILRARTSVMIVRAYQPLPGDIGSLRYQRILLPLDGSQRAELVLPAATALARAHGAEIYVVHVVRQPEMPRRTPLSQEEVELANKVTERNREEASRYLADLKSRFDVRLETHLTVSSNVTSTLHELVEQDRIDLVILSAHGYSGDAKWPYGSTVTGFIAYGTTPLLVVQDIPPDRMELSRAELAAQEQGGR